MSRVSEKKRFRWAWRMLAHVERFALLCIHRQPRGHEERLEAAKWLRELRRAKKARVL